MHIWLASTCGFVHRLSAHQRRTLQTHTFRPAAMLGGAYSGSPQLALLLGLGLDNCATRVRLGLGLGLGLGLVGIGLVGIGLGLGVGFRVRVKVKSVPHTLCFHHTEGEKECTPHSLSPFCRRHALHSLPPLLRKDKRVYRLHSFFSSMLENNQS